MANTKPSKAKQKGQKKVRPDADNPLENPLLKIENKPDFSVDTTNLLEEPTALICDGFTSFTMQRDDNEYFDMEQLKTSSDIKVILRYYEYLCIASFKMSYIVPLLQSDMSMRDVLDMIKHALKMKLLINVPSFDNIFEPTIQYMGKVRY